jgi:hypothetical protein
MRALPAFSPPFIEEIKISFQKISKIFSLIINDLRSPFFKSCIFLVQPIAMYESCTTFVMSSTEDSGSTADHLMNAEYSGLDQSG